MLSTAMMPHGHLHMLSIKRSTVCPKCSLVSLSIYLMLMIDYIIMQPFFTEINPTIDPSLNQHLAEAYGVNGTFQIENFTYRNDALTDVIFRQLEETSFNGITVRP